ncbi:MAG: hypothetical protein M3R36_14145 [Bacteroidota bacterium]|nr:hypothetical protein [Bacteroidota bacterium]
MKTKLGLEWRLIPAKYRRREKTEVTIPTIIAMFINFSKKLTFNNNFFEK